MNSFRRVASSLWKQNRYFLFWERVANFFLFIFFTYLFIIFFRGSFVLISVCFLCLERKLVTFSPPHHCSKLLFLPSSDFCISTSQHHPRLPSTFHTSSLPPPISPPFFPTLNYLLSTPLSLLPFYTYSYHFPLSTSIPFTHFSYLREVEAATTTSTINHFHFHLSFSPSSPASPSSFLSFSLPHHDHSYLYLLSSTTTSITPPSLPPSFPSHFTATTYLPPSSPPSTTLSRGAMWPRKSFCGRVFASARRRPSINSEAEKPEQETHLRRFRAILPLFPLISDGGE